MSSSLAACPTCNSPYGGGDGYCQECGAKSDASACLCARCGGELRTTLKDGTQPVSSFKEAVKRCFKRYATFGGRANRVEYWMWMLFVLIAVSFVVVGWLMLPVVVIPTIAVTTRRLHDVGKSGWWQLIVVVPLGLFWLIYLLCRRGSEEDNSYGIAQM